MQSIPARVFLASSLLLLVAVVSFPASAASLAVPVVMDIQTPATRYRTELTITNRGTSAVQLKLAYKGSIGSASGTVSETVSAGKQYTIPDIIAWLRAKGIPLPLDGSPQLGTLLVTLPESAISAVSLVARTASPTGAPFKQGYAGIAYLGTPASRWATKTAIIYGLRQNSRDRSNLAVYNPTQSVATVRVTAVSGNGDGRQAVIAPAETLVPGGFKQWDKVLDLALMTNGWALVELLSGEAFGAYGVVNDFGTNDGSFLEPVADSPSRARRVIPVIVELPEWQTELVLTNRGEKPATVTLDYRESLSRALGEGGKTTLTLQPREQQIITGIVDFLRSRGVPIGPPLAGNYAGSLRITANVSSPEDFFAGARVSSTTSDAGAFGVFFPGMTDSALASTEAYVTGLRSDASVRSNLAVFHAGEADSGSLELEVQAFDGDVTGAPAGKTERLHLDPGDWYQLNDPLRDRGIANGWFRIRRMTGTAPWSAYGVINDGASSTQGTGDGAFVSAAASPATSARVEPGDLEYLGAFRLPQGGTPPKTFDYGGNAMTFRPGGDPQGVTDGYPGSLFVTGHDRMPYGELPDGSQVAEISIPAPSLSRDVTSLPEATIIQGFSDISGGLFPNLDEIPRIGLQFLDHRQTGPKLHIAWGQHFQPEPPVPSHASCDPALSAPFTTGAWFIADQNQYAVNDYLMEIPASWANLHTGGQVLGTGRYRAGGLSGMGPALFAYRPWDEVTGVPPSPGGQISATPLLLYASTYQTDRIERCINGYQHADDWQGGAWLTTTSGKTAVLFAGTKAVGPRYWYGWVNPLGPDYPCVDAEHIGEFDVCRMADGNPCPASELVPCQNPASERGWWSSETVARLIFYDPADLERVAFGTLAPHEPQPYAFLDIDNRLYLNPSRIDEAELGTGVQRRYRLGDVTFDRESGFLYVLELYADGARPVVHVFWIR